MYISKQDRDALNALCKDIFGASSKWQKMVKDGIQTIVTKEVEEVVPATETEPESTRKVTVPDLDETGKKRAVLKFHTVEETLTMLMDIKTKMDDQRAEQAKRRLEAEMAKKAADLQAKIHAETMGSAL